MSFLKWSASDLESLLISFARWDSTTTWLGEDKTGSFCRYRKALYFWSLGISLYLELFCFLSFITIVYYVICAPVLTEGTIKQSYDDERGEIGWLFEGGHLIEGRLLFEEIRYLGHTTDTIRDLKMPRWRRKWERQLCTCSTLFCTFLYRHCTSTTGKCLTSQFILRTT